MNNSKRILRNRWLYIIQAFIDIAIIDIGYYFGFMIQRPGIFGQGIPNDIIIALLYIAVMSLIFILAFKLHRCGEKTYALTMLYLLISLAMIAVFSVVVDFLIKGIGIWRRTIFYAILLQIPAFTIIKFITYKIHRFIIKPKSCIIIGKTVIDGAKLFLKMFNSKSQVYEVKYIINEDNEKLEEYIGRNSQAIICSSCTKKTSIMKHCAVNNIDCAIIPSFSEILVNSGKFNNMNDVMLYDMKIKMDLEVRILKRTFDIIVSALALVILSPVMLIISIMIKIGDKGRIIYSQKRLTRGNKEFMLYKFRTMIENAEKETGPVLAKASDSRVTKLGKSLRASRMDEIPQLFNVLKGDMSLVGPRPERPSLMETTLKDIPEFGYRTLVKAGLTGLAQTLGRYDTDFSDKIRFDLYYVNNYSLLLDLKILFYTLHTLFTPSVATGLKDALKDKQILSTPRFQNVEIVDGLGT